MVVLDQVDVGRIDQEDRQQRVALSTSRRDEAPAMLARTFPDLVLEPAPGDAPFVFRHTAYWDGRLRSSELMVSGASLLSGSIARSEMGVGLVLGGRYVAEYGRHRVDPEHPFLRPPTPGVARMHDAHVRLVTLDGAALREVGERLEAAGGGRLRLTRSRPVSDEAAAAWRWIGAQVHGTLRDPRLAENPVITGELFDLAARVMLRCFGEVEERGASGELSAAPGAVRRAVAFLEEHAASAVSVPDVAAAARVSVRSLQALFRRHLGVTPLEHLHAIRLEAARRDLLALDISKRGHSVREVAVAWGFGNSGRFARMYAARFGERPSDTLRRRD